MIDILYAAEQLRRPARTGEATEVMSLNDVAVLQKMFE